MERERVVVRFTVAESKAALSWNRLAFGEAKHGGPGGAHSARP